MHRNDYAKQYALEYWEPVPFTKEELQREIEHREVLWLDRLNDKQHRRDVYYETTIELLKKYGTHHKLIQRRKNNYDNASC